MPSDSASSIAKLSISDPVEKAQFSPHVLIRSSDCEGAGEMFQVTTLFSEAEKLVNELKQNPIDPAALESDLKAAKLDVKEKGKAVAKLKSAKASKEDISAAVVVLTKAKENLVKKFTEFFFFRELQMKGPQKQQILHRKWHCLRTTRYGNSCSAWTKEVP